MVQVYRRQYVRGDRGMQMRFEERLRLIVADARELITTLTYVCDRARRGGAAVAGCIT